MKICCVEGCVQVGAYATRTRRRGALNTLINYILRVVSSYLMNLPNRLLT